MKSLKFVLLFVALILLADFSYSAKIYPSAGSTSAAFLKIPVGARASGMGGAFVSVSDDIYSSFYNPAGLSYLTERTISLMHNNYFQSMNQIYMAYGLKGEQIGFLKKYPHLRKGNWAFSMNYFFTPKDLEKRSGFYESDPLYPISPVEGKFRAWDLALGIHYGFNYDAYTNLGASLKLISQNIDTESGNSFAIDLGLMKKVEMLDRVFSLGAVVGNIGPGIKFNSRRYDMPMFIKTGISYRTMENTLLSFDVWKYIDNYPYFILGIEHYLSEKLFLRTGYKYRLNGNELGAWSGFNAGIGFVYNKFSFDYSFSPYGELGYSHKIGINFKFLPPKQVEVVSARELVKAEEKIEDIKRYSYHTISKETKLTPYFIEYRVFGESSESFINKISFKTRLRGKSLDEIYLLTGKLSQHLSKKIKMKNIYSVFQISYPGMILSEVNMEFRIEKEWFELANSKKEDIKILYLSGDGFKKLSPKFLSEDEKFFYCSVSIPQSTHYVIGVP